VPAFFVVLRGWSTRARPSGGGGSAVPGHSL
jgi:hypothetical protein